MSDSDLFTTVKSVYTKMARAALKAERDLSGIRLIAVTKQVPASRVEEAVDAGLREFGESRIQTAKDKIPVVQSLAEGAELVWHLIGHLQKNKVKNAVEMFDLIHSVDSVDLAALVNEHAARLGKVQRVLVQVKLSDEESKYGLGKTGLIDFLRRTGSMKNLKVEGLMTIPPFFEDPEKVRPFFRELFRIRLMAGKQGYHIPELSMGMSHDFEVAIEEGATMVRVGTALFGERTKEEA